jgi:YYY domain-containing protein
MNYAYILIFWLVIQIFGLIGLPLSFSLLRNLPDRGYALAKPLGLLLSGYVLWLLGSFGLLRNNLGGSLLAMVLVAGLGLIWYHRLYHPGGQKRLDQPPGLSEDRDLGILAWLKTNSRYVLTVEAIFALTLIFWSIYKAYNPNIETAGGEKWMEIAFINANLLSPAFPPQDPWLSGFGISYYYFGYLFMAMLIRLSSIVPTTAFNLLIPTLFGLTLIGAYSLIVNLVTVHQDAETPTPTARLTGLLGALFVGILGHLEGVLEVFHARGLLSPDFWMWLDIRDLKVPPAGPGPWIPSRFIWWWRGSRVLTDYNLAGREQEVIDEIPFFSFLLGDVHPHVLALPFVLLAVALALNLLLKRQDDVPPDADPTKVKGLMAAGLKAVSGGVNGLVAATGGWPGFLLYALCLGALGFLNTWDFPIYLAVVGLAYLVWRGRESWLEVVWGMGVFALFGGLLYLPFYIGFQSQAGGILPNLWNPTRLPQFVIFFGPFLLAGIGFLAVLSRQGIWPWRENLPWTLPLSLLGPPTLLGLLLLAFLVLPSGRAYLTGILSSPEVQAALGGATSRELLQEIVRRRVGNPWTFLLLGGLVGWGLAHFWAGLGQAAAKTRLGLAEKFGLILLLMGLLLPLSVEFIFLRDNFGTRMNTVFKFYFQAWVLLALAAAFAVYYVGQSLAGVGRLAWRGAFTVLILAGMVYPVLATLNKANNFNGQPTLDGVAWVKQVYPDDYAAVMWLRDNAPPDAVILEAPAARYAAYRYEGRISALTGRPTLLGWGGHEDQWRGSYDEPARREPDIDLLYNGLDPQTTLTLLDKYDITYVYVGSLERQKYNPNGLAKFENLMDVAFSQGQVVIYQRSATGATASSQ